MLLNEKIPSTRPNRRSTKLRGGFTLLEVMIATAVTLLMMVSLAQIFKVIGDSMKQGRAVLELNNRLRSVVYRIRTDLDNLTAIPEPPGDPSTATGYLKVYDGVLTDYTLALANPSQSRYGDLDDILMGTIKAGDVWFTGKVPLFVLRGTDPDLDTDANGNGIVDDLEPISIASQHAEIAIFVEPTVANSSTAFPAYLNPDRNPGYMVASPNFFKDDNLDGFPDSFRLHYRTLLIRPDLNLPSGLLPARFPIFVASPQSGTLPDGSNFTLPSPLCDMSSIHGLCDLSVRRVFNTGDGLPGTRDYIAANSLEDLVDPANRFAHIQVPLPGTGSTTMPLLALGPKLLPSAAMPIPAIAADPNGGLGGAGFEVGAGFLHPAFTLQGPRAGEDLLGSEILAFDIKLFDPGVPLLGTPGADGFYGTPDPDDNGDGMPNNLAELGWAGSDDLVLSPGDPGYGPAMLTGINVGSGEYVDLAWARKLVAHGFTVSGATNVWSPLSGFSQTNFAANGLAGAYTDGLFKSGAVLVDSSATYVLQPAYDTWTNRFEGDGILQAFRGTLFGNVRINGAVDLYGIGTNDFGNANPAWRRTNIDAGTDGIDNNPTPSLTTPPAIPGGSVADDVSELETLPPFPTQLRGLKISVRMEDPNTRQVKQMSAAKEFVTQ